MLIIDLYKIDSYHSINKYNSFLVTLLPGTASQILAIFELGIKFQSSHDRVYQNPRGIII